MVHYTRQEKDWATYMRKVDTPQTSQRKAVIRRQWSTKMLDIKEDMEGWMIVPLIWRPKIFKTPDELIELFNIYCVSLMQKEVRVRKKASELKKLPDRTIKSTGEFFKEWIITERELVEEWTFERVPSELGFMCFLGIWKSTFKDYQNREEYKEAMEKIHTFCEWQVEDLGTSGKISPQMAQFVLNTSYWRTPAQKNDNDNTLEIKITQ